MEHREEMNCGGDLCKEMLDVGDGQIAARKQQPRDDGWYTYDWMYTYFIGEIWYESGPCGGWSNH